MHHDVAAEQILVGAVLMNNELFAAAAAVKPEDFFEPIHRELWEIAGKLIGMGKRLSIVTVRQFLPKDLKIGEMSIQQYLARLVVEAAIPAEVPGIAAMLRDMADRRAMAEIGAQIAEANEDPAEVCGWAIEQLDEISAARIPSGFRSVSLDESVARAIDAAAQAYARDGAISGLTTGLRDLDRKLLGLQRGELIVLAGRPGSGKTATGLCLARNMARAGYRGRFYSLEMGDVQLSQRMLSDEAFDHEAIQYTRLRSGNFREKQFDALRNAAERLQALPLLIDPQPKISLGQLAVRARQAKRRHGLDFFVVDYLGLMESSGRYKGNRNLEIGELTAGLRALAKELDCAAIVLSQLSRGVEGREDKRPNMGDLRDSGNIEQDADVILMVYREAYYLERREPKSGTAEHEVWQAQIMACINKISLIVEKQRMGPIGSIDCFCDISCNAIRDLGWTRDEFINEPQMAF